MGCVPSRAAGVEIESDVEIGENSVFCGVKHGIGKPDQASDERGS